MKAALIALALLASAPAAHAQYVEGTPCNCDFRPAPRPENFNTQNGLSGVISNFVRAVSRFEVESRTDLARTLFSNGTLREKVQRSSQGHGDSTTVTGLFGYGFDAVLGGDPEYFGIPNRTGPMGGKIFDTGGNQVGTYTGGNRPAPDGGRSRRAESRADVEVNNNGRDNGSRSRD